VVGLLITAGVTLFVANLFDLSSISTMGSSGFLLIFAFVNWANVMLAKETNSRRWISAMAAFMCVGALGSLLFKTAQDDPARLWILLAMIGLAFLVEAGYRVLKGRELHLRQEDHAS
jgi:hypothetical protein